MTGRSGVKPDKSKRTPHQVSAGFTAHRRAGSWGLASRSEYQRRVCELELEVSELRRERDLLRQEAAGLEGSLRYYTECLNQSPVGLVTLDELGKLLEFNKTFAQMTGVARLNELFFARFLAPGYLPRFMDFLLRVQRSPRPLSCDLWLRVLGKNLPVELISCRSNDRNEAASKRLCTIVIDISERIQAEDVRAKQQSDFKVLVDTIQGIVWEADPPTLKLTYVSPRAEQTLGYAKSYWQQGVDWESHIYYEDREWVGAAMRQVARERRDTALEYRMLRADRKVIWVHNSMSTTLLNGRPRLFGVILDITNRKQAEEQLHQARDQLEQRVKERTAELRETVHDMEAFSYSLSHDLRAPLRAMQGYAQLLLNRLGQKLDDTARCYFHRLMNSTERLDRLVQDVLKYSQVARSPVELTSVNLEQLLDQVVNDYPVLLPPRVQIDVQRPLLPVRGHEAFLTQCMSNLIANAAKFNRPGQTPCVTISTQELKRGKVRVWVEDNGIGIAPEDQRRIFGIFERVHSERKYEGTGIGLAIVAKAVERMGGHVGVESAVGHGSRFWLELQRAERRE